MKTMKLMNLMRFGQDEQPTAQQQHFHVARLDAGIALDDRVDRVEALAEIARHQDLAATKAQQERRRSIFKAEGAVQSGHDDPFIELGYVSVGKLSCSSRYRIAQLLYE